MKKTDAEVVMQYREMQLIAEDMGLFTGWGIRTIDFTDEEFIIGIYNTDPESETNRFQEPLFASKRIDECQAYLQGYSDHDMTTSEHNLDLSSHENDWKTASRVLLTLTEEQLEFIRQGVNEKWGLRSLMTHNDMVEGTTDPITSLIAYLDSFKKDHE